MKRMLTAVALITPAICLAQTYGRHPFYLHARSDLRVADRLCNVRDEPSVMRDLQAASGRVREAIRLVDAASVIDRKDVDDNPPIDTYPDRRRRFQAIFQMLASAKRDLSAQEDNLSAVGWRNAAIGQIDQAMNMVKKAAQDDWRDDMSEIEHPHYLHAISDLRYARALLWRRDDAIVMADQRVAIHEIDQAINEARGAAIYDGKAVNYMPPVDTRIRPVDRLNRAIDALNSALRNMNSEEDNRAALGWRAVAVRDTNHAIELTRKAIRDDRAADWFERYQ
jgi:tetratricopeptide (TPR) repeat protein